MTDSQKIEFVTKYLERFKKKKCVNLIPGSIGEFIDGKCLDYYNNVLINELTFNKG